MAVNPLKVFLFLAGGGVAAGATAYVSGALDPYIYGPPAAVADLSEPAPSEPAAPKGERLPGADAAAEPPADIAAPPAMAALTPPADAAAPPADAAAAPPADAAAAPPTDANPPATMAATPPADSAASPPASDSPAPPATGPVVPSFDVVRVEADGSVVVAGKAAPDALVELLNDTQVLGNTDSGAEGDFAIVLDEPLKPGDYQITLRATPKGGAAVMSLETAVLSIPETPGGQVLAMVEEPGKASELLTVPEPPAPAAPKTDEAAAPPAETPAEPKAEEAATPPAETPAEPKVEEAAAPPAESRTTSDGHSPLPPTAGRCRATGDDAGRSHAADAGKPADVAAAPADAAPEPKPAEPAPAPVAAKVAVEAVEIEGNKIFVAGSADPGRYIRVYANEIVLGETRASHGGRFLVEAEHSLAVGNYIIRADVLGADGIEVIARAAVPFEREPGESIAAVAPPADAAGEPAAAATETPPAVAAAEPPAEEPAAPATASAANSDRRRAACRRARCSGNGGAARCSSG